MLRAGRVVVPAKMTSSISPPRRLRAELSPIAQRSASTTLDLPQPFGPTMPVSPGRISTTAGSAKLLKPAMRRRVKLTGNQSSPLAAEGRAADLQVDGHKALEAHLARGVAVLLG